MPMTGPSLLSLKVGCWESTEIHRSLISRKKKNISTFPSLYQVATDTVTATTVYSTLKLCGTHRTFHFMLALWPLPFKNVSLKRLRTTKSLIVKLSYQSPRAPRSFHLQDREALTRGRLGFSHFSGKDTKLRNYQKKKKIETTYRPKVSV